MSDEQGPDRPVNFVEGPVPRSSASRLKGRMPGGSAGPGERTKPATTVGEVPKRLKRMPVPVPVALGVAAVAFILLGLGAARLVTGAGDTPAGATDAAPPATAAAAPATAPPVTAAATVPLPTRPPAEEDAARRATFIESMKGMGLTPGQATCAADKVQATMGWTEISEKLMESGKAAELQAVLLACVKTAK